MKQILNNYISKTIAILLIVLSTACKKDSNDSSNELNSNTFTAIVEGEDFTSTDILAVQLSASKKITITAESKDSKVIQLILPGDITEGTFKIFDLLNTPQILGGYSPVTSVDSFEPLTSGNITITSFNDATNTIEGTFNANTSTITITQGAFNIKFKEL
ncbi:hypothetical protein [uncultured Maribacter sp.]|uniref:hypothetical protein n=1 Tax=uncultured Maribacter sp. TaxID=431308 RepID=UPI002622DF70|nr:hypothetical protein [uncultured Maribacter sp.]